MKRISVVAFAVLCVCMATTTSASAHLFHASTTGKLLGLSEGEQIFTAEAEGIQVKCAHAATTGTVTQVLGLHQLVEVVYSNCKASLATAHVSPAQYLFSADGLVAIENTIIISVLKTALTAPCSIKVAPQNLGTVKFDTDPLNSGALLQLSTVKGIRSIPSGGLCGTAGVEKTTGTYEGNNLIVLDGGTIGWS